MIWKRRVVRWILCVCGAAAVSVFAAAFYFQGVESPETWLVAAAALAVLTPLSSAWSVQITAEMQEDQLPYVIIYLETNTRYQLMHVRMQNVDRGSAFDISDRWDKRLHNPHGKPVRFAMDDKDVSVLHPGQWLSKGIDTPAQFYKAYGGETYGGDVWFSDAAGRTYTGDFLIDPGQFEGTLLYAEEELRTHYEIQQIPKKLGELTNVVKRVVALLHHRDNVKGSDHPER